VGVVQLDPLDDRFDDVDDGHSAEISGNANHDIRISELLDLRRDVRTQGR